MSDLEGDDLALFTRFKKRGSMSEQGRQLKEATHPSRRERASGRTRPIGLRVRPEWHEHLIKLSKEDRRSMIEIIELGLELYERERESFR